MPVQRAVGVGAFRRAAGSLVRGMGVLFERCGGRFTRSLENAGAEEYVAGRSGDRDAYGQ
ncbi:hypothetical protein Saso_06550 [Streptomyces asoensis]|uniref:Uncharacterized protein n=1 Tax=Streptomyces asoensis TaxID=249586 RepID=A0ABQ3RT32_9ACTN|nr:hypothetical protein GCM10010496_00610 [Streptomyces asoensis]GHI59005.1 hypothetical protein Saso_06550 [Streptomyces asoensis]